MTGDAHTPIRWLAAWAAVAGVVWLLAVPIAEQALPMLEVISDLLQRDFLTHLRLDRSAPDVVIGVTATALRPIVVGATSVIPRYADFGVVTIDVVHVAVPIVIFGTLLAGWPLRSRREIVLRGIAACAAVPVLLLPSAVTLVGRMDALLLKASVAAVDQSQAMIDLMLFLELGGRWLTALLVSALALAVTRRLDAGWGERTARRACVTGG